MPPQTKSKNMKYSSVFRTKDFVAQQYELPPPHFFLDTRELIFIDLKLDTQTK